MRTPRGLRKPRRVALLVPIVVALVGAVAAFVFGFMHLARTGATGDGEAGAPTAGYAPSLFQPEVFFGLGAAALLFVLIYGVWRTRSGSKDR